MQLHGVEDLLFDLLGGRPEVDLFGELVCHGLLKPVFDFLGIQECVKHLSAKPIDSGTWLCCCDSNDRVTVQRIRLGGTLLGSLLVALWMHR